MGYEGIIKRQKVRNSVNLIISDKHNGLNDFCNLVRHQLGDENIKLQKAHQLFEKQSKLN